jgi:hypothetical protein
MFRKTVYFDGDGDKMDIMQSVPKGKTAINFYNFGQNGFKDQEDPVEDDGFYPDKATGDKSVYIGDNPDYKHNFDHKLASSMPKQSTGLTPGLTSDNDIAKTIAKHRQEKWKNPTAKKILDPSKIKLYANKLAI